MDIITFDKVSKIYGSVVAVSEISGAIGEGIVGFLGPNGAGKTSVIRMLIGDLKPSEGHLLVFGEDPWYNFSLRERIGYIPEKAKLFEWMTPLKFVTKLGQIGRPREEAIKAAEDALTTMEAYEYRNRQISTLSKGMRQRVKIAIALSRPRDLIIADEPLAGLDPLGRELIFDLFHQLWKEHQTSVFVSSHILFEVQRFTQQIVMMYEGRIIARGKTKELRRLLEYPYSFEVVSTSPHDLIHQLFLRGIIQSAQFPQGFPSDEQKSALIHITTTKPDELTDTILELTENPKYRIIQLVNLEEQVATEQLFSYLIKGRA